MQCDKLSLVFLAARAQMSLGQSEAGPVPRLRLSFGPSGLNANEGSVTNITRGFETSFDRDRNDVENGALRLTESSYSYLHVPLTTEIQGKDDVTVGMWIKPDPANKHFSRFFCLLTMVTHAGDQMFACLESSAPGGQDLMPDSVAAWFSPPFERLLHGHTDGEWGATVPRNEWSYISIRHQGGTLTMQRHVRPGAPGGGVIHTYPNTGRSVPDDLPSGIVFGHLISIAPVAFTHLSPDEYAAVGWWPFAMEETAPGYVPNKFPLEPEYAYQGLMDDITVFDRFLTDEELLLVAFPPTPMAVIQPVAEQQGDTDSDGTELFAAATYSEKSTPLSDKDTDVGTSDKWTDASAVAGIIGWIIGGVLLCVAAVGLAHSLRQMKSPVDDDAVSNASDEMPLGGPSGTNSVTEQPLDLYTGPNIVTEQPLVGPSIPGGNAEGTINDVVPGEATQGPDMEVSQVSGSVHPAEEGSVHESDNESDL